MKCSSIIVLMLLLLSSMRVLGQPSANVSVLYCRMLNYPTSYDDEYSQYMVTLPNGTKVSTWEFFRGEVGRDYSYCNKKGYKLKSKAIKDKNGVVRMYKPVCFKGTTEKSLVRFIYENGNYKNLYTMAPPPEDSIFPPEDTVEEPPPSGNNNSFNLDYRTVPNFLDGVVDQANEGICYAIAAATTAGAAYYKATSNYGGFSPYPIINCGTCCFGEFYIPPGGTYGIRSGFEEKALEFLVKQGTVKKSEVITSLGPCSSSYGTNATHYIFNSYIQVTSIDNIKASLLSCGPLFAVIKYASGSTFESYHLNPGQVVILSNTIDCNSANVISHCVVIVGYGTDTNGETFWIIRNSWGIGWGDGGYGYIKASSFASTCKVYAINYSPSPAIQDNSYNSTWSFSLLYPPVSPPNVISWSAINPASFTGPTSGTGTTANLTPANLNTSFTGGVTFTINSGCYTPDWTLSLGKSNTATGFWLYPNDLTVQYDGLSEHALTLSLDPNFLAQHPNIIQDSTRWEIIGSVCPFKIRDDNTRPVSVLKNRQAICIALCAGTSSLKVTLYPTGESKFFTLTSQAH